MEALEDKITNMAELVPPNTFLLGYRGSISHGTQIPRTNPDSIDDVDLLGVCFGPTSSYLGLGRFEQLEKFVGEYDSVVYEVKKFVRLLAGCNPNVISLLWLRPEDYIRIDPAGEVLLSNRELFLSKQIYQTFAGYARGCMAKISRGDFQGYMGDKRKELVKRFGYDTKNAAHLIRLLRMSITALETGEVQVHRPDAMELIAIKSGMWPLDDVKREAEILFKKAEKAFETSSLPDQPEREKIETLLEGLVWDYLKVAKT